jgi:hypothetical protein
MLGIAVNRFFIEKNYILEYRIACDVATGDCFVDRCTSETISSGDCDPSPYKIIKKNASDVYAACGTDIRSCTAARYCTAADSYCEILSCDSGSVSEERDCTLLERYSE